MSLTASDKARLQRLNSALKRVLENQIGNPTSFEVQVDCLKAMAMIFDSYFLMISKYINHTSPKNKIIKYFEKHRATHRSNSCDEIIEQSRMILFDKELEELKKSAFSGKLVAGLNVYINPDHKSQQLLNGLFLEPSPDITYEIQFDDGTSVKWYDMNNEKQLKKAKALFEQKVPRPQEIKYLEDDSEEDDSEDMELSSCYFL